MWIITGVAALAPAVVFAALMEAGSRAAMFVPGLAGYLLAAFALGLWGSWLIEVCFLRGDRRGHDE